MPLGFIVLDQSLVVEPVDFHFDRLHIVGKLEKSRNRFRRQKLKTREKTLGNYIGPFGCQYETPLSKRRDIGVVRLYLESDAL